MNLKPQDIIGPLKYHGIAVDTHPEGPDEIHTIDTSQYAYEFEPTCEYRTGSKYGSPLPLKPESNAGEAKG